MIIAGPMDFGMTALPSTEAEASEALVRTQIENRRRCPEDILPHKSASGYCWLPAF